MKARSHIIMKTKETTKGVHAEKRPKSGEKGVWASVWVNFKPGLQHVCQDELIYWWFQHENVSQKESILIALIGAAAE